MMGREEVWNMAYEKSWNSILNCSAHFPNYRKGADKLEDMLVAWRRRCFTSGGLDSFINLDKASDMVRELSSANGGRDACVSMFNNKYKERMAKKVTQPAYTQVPQNLPYRR